MATTASGDVVIYDIEFYSGYVETLQQNVDAFNEASQGALVMRDRALAGQYEKQSFFDEVSSIARRDPSNDSSSSASATKLTMDEFIGVKLNRRNGPYQWNIGAAGLAGFDAAEFSRAVGVMTAKATPKEMLDRSLAALEGKLDAVAALEHDATDGTLATSDLIDGLANFGDAAGDIRLWVMHSKPYFDLVKAQVASTATIYGSPVFGAQIYEGAPWTANRPVLVTDSASLISYTDVSSASPVYSTLGLTMNAAEIDVTEPPFAVARGPITGADNLYIEWQGEYGYNLKLRGCAWKTATGANPTNTQVATGSNWVTKIADNKLLPGVLVRSD